MDYNSRPVFTWSPNWESSQPIAFDFDLRELMAGFGDRTFDPLQSNVTHGFDFSVSLYTAAEINCFDAFFETLLGNIDGFWLPSPLEAMKFSAGVSATQFDIDDQSLTDTLSDHPATHAQFFNPDSGLRLFAEITACADNGDGTERVTIDGTFAGGLDSTWQIKRLHYVRLAGDTERGQFLSEGVQTRSVRVVELPTEYTTPTSGTKPVWLYHFWTDSQDWRFTSHAASITSNGNVFTAGSITHGRLIRSTDNIREDVEISARYESTNPLSKLFPLQLFDVLWVEIHEATTNAPDSSTLRFYGRVQSAPVRHPAQKAKCSSLVDILGRSLPRMPIGYGCPYQVYDSATCAASQATFDESVTVDTISSRTVTVSDAALAGIAADYFALGWIQAGTGATLEKRSVMASTAASGNSITLTLNAEFSFTVVTDTATLVPGCDGNYSVCNTKFSNTANFGGFPSIPQRNLALRAVSVDSQTGKK